MRKLKRQRDPIVSFILSLIATAIIGAVLFGCEEKPTMGKKAMGKIDPDRNRKIALMHEANIVLDSMQSVSYRTFTMENNQVGGKEYKRLKIAFDSLDHVHDSLHTIIDGI